MGRVSGNRFFSGERGDAHASRLGNFETILNRYWMRLRRESIANDMCLFAYIYFRRLKIHIDVIPGESFNFYVQGAVEIRK